MKLLVTHASASGGDDEPQEKVSEAVFRAASALITTLSLTEKQLTAQNPLLKPYLAAIIDEFVEYATMTIGEMTAEGTEGRQQHDD